MKTKSLIVFLFCFSTLYGQWTKNINTPLVLAEGPAAEFDVSFAYDKSGNSYYTWTDFRNGNGDIYVQKLNSYGEPQLVHGGLRVGNVVQGINYELSAKCILPLSNGGLAIVWHKKGNRSSSDSWSLNFNVVDKNGNLANLEGVELKSEIRSSGPPNASLLIHETTSEYEVYYNSIVSSGSDTFNRLQISKSDLSNRKDTYLTKANAEGSKFIWSDELNRLIILHKSKGANEEFSGTFYEFDGDDIVASSLFNSFSMDPFAGNSEASEWYAQDGAIFFGRTLVGGGKKRVIAHKLNNSFQNQWQDAGVILGSDTGYDIHIGANSTEGAILAWNEPSGSNTKMMAAGINASGEVLWQKPVFTTQPGKNYFTPHKFASDGQGGAYILWFTSKSVGFNLSIQHLDANGNKLFGEYGLDIDAFKWWGDYRLIPHTSGGVVALYTGSKNDDINASTYDLYTTYISPDGTFGIDKKLSVNLEKNVFCKKEEVIADLPSGDYTAKLDYGDATFSLQVVNGKLLLPAEVSQGKMNLQFFDKNGLASEVLQIEVVELSKPNISASAEGKCPETDDVIVLDASCNFGSLLWDDSSDISQRLVSPGVTTTYSATCEKEGCAISEVSQKQITVYEVNATASGNQEVNEGNTINLIATGGDNYSWSGPNGFSSNMQNPEIPNATLNMSGTYTVQVTNSLGCSSFAETQISVKSVLSAERDSDFQIYPNPTKDYVMVSLARTYLKVEAISVNGQVTDLPISANRIDLRGLQEGIYVLKLTDKERVARFYKIMKQ